VQIFFVLRKKNNQITTLHVVHHAGLPLGCWYMVKFSAGNVTNLHSAFDSLSRNLNEHVDLRKFTPGTFYNLLLACTLSWGNAKAHVFCTDVPSRGNTSACI
jgi:hypothetical protein